MRRNRDGRETPRPPRTPPPVGIAQNPKQSKAEDAHGKGKEQRGGEVGGSMDAAQEKDAGAPRKRTVVRRRWGGEDDVRERLGPAAPPEDAGKEAALAECAVSCCLFCACLPVAVLCCVARAPVRAAQRCWRWRRRRPPRRLAPGGSSSFSDAELGDFRQCRRRPMADEGDRPRSRSPRGSRTSPPPPQQPPPRDRRR